jgi:hypothetical protein
MPISVLATRCRYCGETVGRPRKEEERFTVKDLGGEQKTSYTLPGNVREALEAYRAEMFSEPSPDAEAAGPDTGSPRFNSKTGIPEIDEQHSNLAALLDLPTGPSAPRTKARPAADRTRLVLQILAGTAAVIIVLLALRYSWAAYQNYAEAQRAAGQVVYVNMARSMLEKGQYVEAIAEAQEALHFNDTPENRAIADEVRAALANHVERRLNAERWSQAELREASALVNRALGRDKSPALQELLARVDAEIADYKLVLRQVDTATGEATFIVHSPSVPEREQVVREGDYVGDRFLVKKILGNLVRLEDVRVPVPGGNRQVVCRVMTQASPE